MKKKQLNKLAEEMWNVGVASIHEKFPNHSYSSWERVSEQQRHGWLAAVKHAVKTLNAKKK